MSSARLLGLLLLSTTAGAEPEAEQPRTLYQVRPGDSLWSIAASVIGDPSLWPALYRVNRDQIKDPARVYPGQLLTIPDVPPEAIRALRREAIDLLAR